MKGAPNIFVVHSGGELSHRIRENRDFRDYLTLPPSQ